jgi:hypothetical protein
MRRAALLVVLLLVAAGTADARVSTYDAVEPRQSVWETLRDKLREAIRLENQALTTNLREPFDRDLRKSIRSLQDAKRLLRTFRDELESHSADADVGDVTTEIDRAIAADREAIAEQEARVADARVREANRHKTEARLVLLEDFGFGAEARNNANVAEDDDFVLQHEDVQGRRLAGTAAVEVDEIWFTSSRRIAATSGVAVFEQSGAIRFTPATLSSPYVYRFQLEQPLLPSERLAVSFKGLPSGTLVVFDLVSFEDGVQRVAVRTR